MTLRSRTRSVFPYLVLGVAVLAGLLLVLVQGLPGIEDPATVTFLAMATVAVLVGEWFTVIAPRFRGSAPVATAAAYGMAFGTQLPGGAGLAYGPLVVLVLVGLAMAVTMLVRHQLGRLQSLIEAAGRFVGVLVVTDLYRSRYLGQKAGDLPAVDSIAPWQLALLLLVIAGVGVVADSAFTSTMRWAFGLGSWWAMLWHALRSSFVIASATAVTGVLIALALPAVGIAAMPLFLFPLVLTLFAFRRYVAVRTTYLQSIRTLSRLTDVAGYTPAGHAERVASLCVAIGRDLGLADRSLLDLEYAALLHDIGQVALVEPIPDGATVLAAPADQRRIEVDTLAIIEEAGVSGVVAGILRYQATPYRQFRELGEQIPLASRVLKVANAYEDFTRGNRDSTSTNAATERIYLGLGYEFDPAVVDSLLRVIGARARR